MKKLIIGLASSFFGLTMAVVPVFAHVVVGPAEVGVASFQTFTMGVPNEKDMPTTTLRLMIPEGLKSVSPNVKPGWTVSVKKTGDGDSAKVLEIDWTGGSIPVGQRDDFLFSAQVPASEAKLLWKAYQTYQDGTVVAWDADPVTIKSGDEGTPYSQTKVINDLTATKGVDKSEMVSGKAPLVLSVLAVLMSAAALGMVFKKK